MKILPDDPRLTAYALGELEDPQERAAIEQAIQNDPSLQAEVESIRSMSSLLSDELNNESATELSEFEKTQLLQPASETTPHSPRRVLLSWPVVTGIAALLAVMLYLGNTHVERTDYGAAFRQEEDVNEPTEVLDVETQPEFIEGTPQPIKVPTLKPEATEAPRFAVDETVSPDDHSNKSRKDQLSKIFGEDISASQQELELATAGAPEIYVDPETGDFFQTDAPQPIEGADITVPPPSAKQTQKSMPQPLASQSPQDIVVAEPQIEATALNLAIGRGLGGGLGAIGDGYIAQDYIQDVESIASFGLPSEAEPHTNWNTERYDPIEESGFRSPLVAPLSTFSIDVDTASYANVRRFLNQGQLPPADAVRIEELINYFPYSDAPPSKSLDEGGDPFAVHMAQTYAPWNPEHHLLRIALKGYEMPWDERPASNLVFVLDVSGSMNSANKLPLLKDAMNMLVQRLDERDRVAIVVYAGASGLVLPSTTANNTQTIEHALNNMKAGGSTNAGAGINLAYKVARDHFIEDGNNRVILCTDGDFNVGQTNRSELADIAEEQAEQGTSLTILGFGMGNYKDDMLEELSNKGKGSYAYIDSRSEARKVFLEDLTSNLFKIAKDVKIQVEFNPNQVKAYRLIGYENRRLKAEDFNNDQKKAGDIGPGHSIVALYELVPSGVSMDLPGVDPLRYQQQAKPDPSESEVATVKLRYKQPDATVSKLIEQSVRSDELTEFKAAHDDLRFSAAVAAFGLRLRQSESIGDYNYTKISRLAANALAADPGGHRSEFIDLVEKANKLSK